MDNVIEADLWVSKATNLFWSEIPAKKIRVGLY